MLTITEQTRRAIVDTWCGIADDAYDQCEDDNEIAIELTIDANRLTMAGYPAADAEISELCKKYDFGKVRAALSKTIQLL